MTRFIWMLVHYRASTVNIQSSFPIIIQDKFVAWGLDTCWSWFLGRFYGYIMEFITEWFFEFRDEYKNYGIYKNCLKLI